MVTLTNKPQIRFHVCQAFVQSIKSIIRYQSGFRSLIKRSRWIWGFKKNHCAIHSKKWESYWFSNL